MFSIEFEAMLVTNNRSAAITKVRDSCDNGVAFLSFYMVVCDRK